MIDTIFSYLFQGTVILVLCALTYHLFFRKLTYFQWNRFYLLGSVIASGIIPLLPIPALLAPATPADLFIRFDAHPVLSDGFTDGTTVFAAQTVDGLHWIGHGLLGVYLLGVLYKSARLYRNLRVIFRLKEGSQLVEEGARYSVYIQSELPTFSFGRSIFLNLDYESLTLEEQAQVLLHEEIHVQHRHTLDLLLFELADIILWFNPLVRYLHLSIRQVHEYIVDASVIRLCGNVRQYGYLLLKMSSETTLPLLATFSNKQLFRRIQMLTQKPSGSSHKLKFLIVVPLLAFTLLLSSCFHDSHESARTAAVKPQSGVPIAAIVWKGNKRYTTGQLNEIVELRPGDLYQREALANRLTNRVGADLKSLYMDNGHLFFDVQVKEKSAGDAMNLELSVYEGPQVMVGNVVFKGNRKITDEQMRKTVAVRPGELFNRSSLLKSQRLLAESGYFKPNEIGVNPIPNREHNTVDLEFVVVEK